MARIGDLDFGQFVRTRRGAPAAPEAPATSGMAVDAAAPDYAYRWDRTTRRAFEAAKPVELAVAAGVRVFEHVERARLLGSAVKVGPRQFGRVHEAVKHCAGALGIAAPAVYIVNSPTLNGATYGTSDDAFVLLHSALVDHFAEDELLSVIGHECGHIHNRHVVYLTALHTLTEVGGLFVRWIGLPALLALRAWSRRAEITCDRAAALCAGSIVAPSRALAKLALGSTKLYQDFDLEAFLDQDREGKQSFGRYLELVSTHPYLPKRVLALREFGKSRVWCSRRGEAGGDDLDVVDERVHELVRVLG